jgi:sigma-E factor negative regulatory protein RseA
MRDAVTTNEHMSALADGQLRGRDFAQALDLAAEDDEALACWHTYHLIGDVLRSPDLACPRDAGAFLVKLRGQLAQEASRPRPAKAVAATGAVAVEQLVAEADAASRTEAANARSWKLVAGLASFAAVAAIGWNMAGPSATGGAAPALAGAPGVAAQLAEAGAGQAVIRDPRLDELLAAHKQAGGSSALQMPAGFLRNATYEASSR